MFVSESVLPDADVHMAFHQGGRSCRRLAAGGRALGALHRRRRRLRPGLAEGKFDAFLLMPRGVRDEEFHTAVTELLSDWGSTVPDPEVEAVRIVGDPDDPLTLSIRDFLVRMGMPHRVHAPESDGRPGVIAAYDGHRRSRSSTC